MAAVDKIYGTKCDWFRLKKFLESKYPELLKYLYPLSDTDGAAIFNGSYEADIWLKKNCPLHFIQTQLKDIYSDEWNNTHQLIRRTPGLGNKKGNKDG